MQSVTDTTTLMNRKPGMGSTIQNEYSKTFEAFYERPATMRMIEVRTGILRPNICRYVARLKRKGMIKLVRYGYCPFTHHIAGFYCTNPQIILSEKVVTQCRLF